MKNPFEKNWTNYNNGFPLEDEEVSRLISVTPSGAQFRLSQRPFYLFVHFGMNTATGREWGAGTEKCSDFTIKKVKPKQWVKCAQAAGASGIILTCKHHDGFCLWPSEYTDFSVKNTDFSQDIVRLVADACKEAELDFGIYLSPWDMHEKSYGTAAYDDYFCNQLTELLGNYGEISEVWFDGAKGANARDCEYDWQRYYKIVRDLQPQANIAVCGPDIRWVGNESGKTRKTEYSVVPKYLQDAEIIAHSSQKAEGDAVKKLTSKDEDLGSRAVLAGESELCWYPAEVDVSIRDGWFWNKEDNSSVKNGKKLFDIYVNSVGNNCTLLLNVPPTDKGFFHSKDAKALKKLGQLVNDLYSKPVIVEKLGTLSKSDEYIDFNFGSVKKIRYAALSENILLSQRVEAFDIYLKKINGKYTKAYSGTVIGSKKLAYLGGKKCVGARLVIRQSRGTPVLSEVGFYE